MKKSNAWKSLERKVAKELGGKRVYRGRNFAESLPDVFHPLFTIECKSRKKGIPKFVTDGLDQAAKYDKNKIPLLVMKVKSKHGEIACLPFKDLVALYNIDY